MEALKLTEAESFWEELMKRDKELLLSVSKLADRNDTNTVEFQKAITAVGPVLVVMKGEPMYLASQMAEHLKCTHARWFDAFSSSLYMDDTLFQEEVLLEISSSQLSLGHSVLADTVLLSRQQVDRLLELSDSRGALLVIIKTRSSQGDPEPPEIASPSDRIDIPVLIIDDLDPRDGSLDISFHSKDKVVLEFILLCMDIKLRCEKEVPNQSLESGKSKLRHFSHPHMLTLQESIGEIEVECCICSALISGLYYACPSCKFFVHRSCAELPQYVEASFHRHPLRLVVLSNESKKTFTLSKLISFPEKIDPFHRSSSTRSLPSLDSSYWSKSKTESLLSCIICDTAGERPFYKCWQCYDYFVHYECAMAATADIDHSCHIHPLKLRTFEFSREDHVFTCYACGAKGSAISYSCMDCNFHFHPKCALTIPLSVQHKRHEHPLVLSSPPKDFTNEYYCEICETRRHPDYWIYYCQPCEYEAHLSCTNPDIPPYSMPEDEELPGESDEGSTGQPEARDSKKKFRFPWPIFPTQSSPQVGHQELLDMVAASPDTEDGEGTMEQRKCAHDLVLHNRYKENLAALIIAVKGHPCTGRNTVAQSLAKALKCTLIAHDGVRECVLRAQEGLSEPECLSPKSLSELTYKVLWRVAETQLKRNHHVVIDLPLSRRDHFEQLLTLAESTEAIVVIVECAPQDHIGSQRFLEKFQVAGGDDGASSSYKPSSGEDSEVLSEQLGYEDCDASGVQVPKLMVDTASVNELEEQIESAKKLVRSCLYDKFNGESVLEDYYPHSQCVHCRMAFIRSRVAGLPTRFKHEVDQHELCLVTHETAYAWGTCIGYSCNACARLGENFHYYCYTCRLMFHPKCVLELPLTVEHKCHWHALALRTSLKDDTYQYYCDVCEEQRGVDDWIYYCESCDYQAHVTCVIDPQFFDDGQFKESEGYRSRVTVCPLLENFDLIEQ